MMIYKFIAALSLAMMAIAPANATIVNVEFAAYFGPSDDLLTGYFSYDSTIKPYQSDETTRGIVSSYNLSPFTITYSFYDQTFTTPFEILSLNETAGPDNAGLPTDLFFVTTSIPDSPLTLGLGFAFPDDPFVGNMLPDNLDSAYALYSFIFPDPYYVVGEGPLAFAATYGAAVPEPATWAMMIGGFGLVGGALRRRRPRVNVAIA